MTENKQQRPIPIASFSALSAVAEIFCAPEMPWLRCRLPERDGSSGDDAGTFLDRDELTSGDLRKRVFLPARPHNFNADRPTGLRFPQSKRQRQLALRCITGTSLHHATQSRARTRRKR